MDVCPDCGNHQISPRPFDGLVAFECDLCGAMAGDPRAIHGVQMTQKARELGIDPHLWPLMHVLGGLPGLHVLDLRRVEAARFSLPCVQWHLVDAKGFAQVENLTKSLMLSRGQLQLPWRIELSYERSMVFTLLPCPQGPLSDHTIVQVEHDLDILALSITRDSRLSWWVRPKN
jgi:hypothetical protein